MATKKNPDEVIAPPRRKLSEIYVEGDVVEFPDPKDPDNPLKVWIQKPTPAEDKVSIRKAKPAKLAISRIKRLPEDSDEKFEFYDKLDEPRFETLRKKLAYLVSTSVEEFRQTASAQVANEPHWAEDDFLIELQDTWNEEFKVKFIDDPEDKDAKAIHDQLERFTVEVEDSINDHEALLISELEDLTEDEINKKVVQKLIEEESNIEMYNEFRRQQLFLGTRDFDDHSKRHFDTREEIDALPSEPYITLLAGWLVLNMDSIEGKG